MKIVADVGARTAEGFRESANGEAIEAVGGMGGVLVHGGGGGWNDE
jgi:hypothetical protein